MNQRKKFLTVCVSTLIFLGFIFLSIPFLRSWFPNAKSSGIMAINPSKIHLGEPRLFEPEHFRSIMVYRPDEEAKLYLILLNDVANGDDFNIKNIPEYFIYHPFGTYLGCHLQKVKKDEPLSYGYAGLVDPCHRGFWDFAGRLIPSAHAGEGLKNLKEFTNYKHISKDELLLGY